MTKTIKEVLANLTEHTEVSRYAVETGLKTPAENYENIQRKINHALSEIEKIMDGVIGEDEEPKSFTVDTRNARQRVCPQCQVPEGVVHKGDCEWLTLRIRNHFRTNQRQSLKEVLGE